MQAALGRMGCSANGCQRLYTGQGLKSIDMMADVSDNAIANMCKILRRDEAVPVSAMAEEHLKLGCFVARHYRQISRNLTLAGLTRNLINNYRDLKAEEDAYETPDNNIEIDKKDWAKTMDAIKSLDWSDTHKQSHAASKHDWLVFATHQTCIYLLVLRSTRIPTKNENRQTQATMDVRRPSSTLLHSMGHVAPQK